MPTSIHIDELILHDFDLPESHSITFERALTAELSRLLGAGNLPTASFAAPRLSVTLPRSPASPMALGKQAATSGASLFTRTDSDGSPVERTPRSVPPGPGGPGYGSPSPTVHPHGGAANP